MTDDVRFTSLFRSISATKSTTYGTIVVTASFGTTASLGHLCI